MSVDKDMAESNIKVELTFNVLFGALQCFCFHAQ